MRLCELSDGYLEAANLLKKRMAHLRKQRAEEADSHRRFALKAELQVLAKILTQCNELAELTARYYERGYTRNEKYTL